MLFENKRRPDINPPVLRSEGEKQSDMIKKNYQETMRNFKNKRENFLNKRELFNYSKN